MTAKKWAAFLNEKIYNFLRQKKVFDRILKQKIWQKITFFIKDLDLEKIVVLFAQKMPLKCKVFKNFGEFC